MMVSLKTARPSLAAICGVAGLLAGCAGSGGAAFQPAPTQPLGVRVAATGETLFAYSIGTTPLLAEYALPASGPTDPAAVINGSNTRLRGGTANRGGVAVDADGTIYVLSEPPARLLVFKAGAHGNVKPVRVAVLPKRSAAFGYSGIALDGQGNFWTADITGGEMVRFSLSARGPVQPSFAIEPKMLTPIGALTARPNSVATDALGDVYCACGLVHHGAQALGISEYRITGNGAKLIRSFFDFALPERPPSMLHVDAATGTMYLNNDQNVIYAYPKNQPSGQAKQRRIIYGPELVNFEALTTDGAGRIYVATPRNIIVFRRDATGRAKPLSSMSDRQHLQFAAFESGDFLAIH
jgi:hypothetical protein